MALLYRAHHTVAWGPHSCARHTALLSVVQSHCCVCVAHCIAVWCHIIVCDTMTLVCVVHCITVRGRTLLSVAQPHWCVCVAHCITVRGMTLLSVLQ